MGRRPGVRTWAPLAMAAKVDLSTSTDWKEAKCKWKREGRGWPTWVSRLVSTPEQPLPPGDLGKLRSGLP